MKKRILTTILVSLIALCGFAQTEERTVDAFSGINVCCGIDVYITQGASNTIKVETNYAEVLPRIITKVKNNNLQISIQGNNNGSKYRNLKMAVYVSIDNLTSVYASSGADVTSNGQLKAEDVTLNAESGADIKLNLKADNLKCKASSGADINLEGSASYADVQATSGADVDMKKMTANKAKVDASSAGDIEITVTDEINASASSGGDITYHGSPKIVKKHTSSGGDITDR